MLALELQIMVKSIVKNNLWLISSLILIICVILGMIIFKDKITKIWKCFLTPKERPEVYEAKGNFVKAFTNLTVFISGLGLATKDIVNYGGHREIAMIFYIVLLIFSILGFLFYIRYHYLKLNVIKDWYKGSPK